MNFDFTNQGRRPSAAQIVAAWKAAGKPNSFSVDYGETFAQFNRGTDVVWLGANRNQRWLDSGNGCRGVDRNAVVKLLEAEEA